jgi:hypothetical protein
MAAPAAALFCYSPHDLRIFIYAENISCATHEATKDVTFFLKKISRIL